MVGFSNPPHDAALVRTVLAGDPVGLRTGRKDREAVGARRGLVQEVGSDVLGLTRHPPADPLRRRGGAAPPSGGSFGARRPCARSYGGTIFRLGGREHEPPKNPGLFNSGRRSLCPTPPNTPPNRQSPARGAPPQGEQTGTPDATRAAHDTPEGAPCPRRARDPASARPG